MPYNKTVWDETIGVTPARLNNLETQHAQAVADSLPRSGGNITGNLTIANSQVVTAANIGTYAPPVDTGDQPGGTTYVDYVNGVNAVGRGGSSTPYKTIPYAISQWKDHLLSQGMLIRIRAGTYPESINISDFDGAGISIEADTSSGASKTNVIITGYIALARLNIDLIDFYNLRVENCIDTRGANCRVEITGTDFATTTNPYGIIASDVDMYVSSCTFSNKTTAIDVGKNGRVTIANSVTGSSNTTGINCDAGGIVTITGTISMGATTTFKVASGGNIFNVPSGKIWV